jgi:hypothetical protein
MNFVHSVVDKEGPAIYDRGVYYWRGMPLSARRTTLNSGNLSVDTYMWLYKAYRNIMTAYKSVRLFPTRWLQVYQLKSSSSY